MQLPTMSNISCGEENKKECRRKTVSEELRTDNFSELKKHGISYRLEAT